MSKRVRTSFLPSQIDIRVEGERKKRKNGKKEEKGRKRGGDDEASDN